MTDRRDEKGTTEQFHELFGTDAFLDDLSRGVDPSDGADPLAAMMLELHREVNAPIPNAPSLDELLPAAPAVASLDKQRRRRVSPWMASLVGAAAATVLLAGTGGAIYNADPSSPLWGAKTAVFGGHAAVVDLASALDEVDKRHAEGDVEGAMRVLEQARILADAVNSQDRQSTQRAINELEARIVEVETTVTQSVPTTATSVAVETSVATTTEKEPVIQLPPVIVTEVETVTVTVVQPPTAPETSGTVTPPTTVTTTKSPTGEPTEVTGTATRPMP
ncbi:hypothetical protein WG915_04735 [Corynebacterium sp. H128]|uniref:hypothetical protein n=1 Tax=unclassified Corynebacterium TaxID=2624378 RepID=UPI0030B67BE4